VAKCALIIVHLFGADPLMGFLFIFYLINYFIFYFILFSFPTLISPTYLPTTRLFGLAYQLGIKPPPPPTHLPTY
jgi:hypothetical protein